MSISQRFEPDHSAPLRSRFEDAFEGRTAFSCSLTRTRCRPERRARPAASEDGFREGIEVRVGSLVVGAASRPRDGCIPGKAFLFLTIKDAMVSWPAAHFGVGWGVLRERWHYVVGTYDGAHIQIYVDGVPGSRTEFKNASLVSVPAEMCPTVVS